MILKRVLTRKSILGFGYSSVRDLSVQMIIDSGQKNYLISSYFGLDKIDFQEDILIELGITQEYRILKPGKNNDLKSLFYQNRMNQMSEKERIIYLTKRKKETKENYKTINSKRSYSESKQYLKNKNQNQ
jgi:hypothetical protein